jgi:hypothetical protein
VISFFKSQHISTILVFLLLFFCIKIPFLLSGTLVPVTAIQQIWGTTGLLFEDSTRFNLLLAQVSLLAQAFWFNYLFQKADYHEQNSMVPALYYALISALLPQFNVFSVYHIIALVMLAIFQTLLSVSGKEHTKIYCFNLGVLAGILYLIYPHFLFFLPFLFAIMFVTSNAKFSDYVLLIFGVLFPLYLVFSVSYITQTELNLNSLSVLDLRHFTFQYNMLNAIVLGITALYLLFSFVSMRGIMFSAGIRRRKNVNMLIVLLLGTLLTLLLNDNADETAGMLLFIPVSLFLVLFMLRIRKKRLGEILNVIFVLVTFVTNIVRLFK